MRRLMVSLMVFALAIAGQVAIAPQALACSCAPDWTDEKAWAAADVVFVGTVVDSSLLGDVIGSPSEAVRVFSFAVVQVYKGRVASNQEVRTGADDVSCGTLGIRPRGAPPYLIFARRGRTEGTLATGLCAGNRPLAAAPLPASFGQARAPDPTADGSANVAASAGSPVTPSPVTPSPVGPRGGPPRDELEQSRRVDRLPLILLGIFSAVVLLAIMAGAGGTKQLGRVGRLAELNLAQRVVIVLGLANILRLIGVYTVYGGACPCGRSQSGGDAGLPPSWDPASAALFMVSLTLAWMALSSMVLGWFTRPLQAEASPAPAEVPHAPQPGL